MKRVLIVDEETCPFHYKIGDDVILCSRVKYGKKMPLCCEENCTLPPLPKPVKVELKDDPDRMEALEYGMSVGFNVAIDLITGGTS